VKADVLKLFAVKSNRAAMILCCGNAKCSKASKFLSKRNNSSRHKIAKEIRKIPLVSTWTTEER
jgi:hypothetical protein